MFSCIGHTPGEEEAAAAGSLKEDSQGLGIYNAGFRVQVLSGIHGLGALEGTPKMHGSMLTFWKLRPGLYLTHVLGGPPTL